MGLTIYDLKLSFTWQKIHAHQFTTSEEADRFCAQVEGRWVRRPSVNRMHGHPVELVSNTAGCFVMNFQYPNKNNARTPRKAAV